MSRQSKRYLKDTAKQQSPEEMKNRKLAAKIRKAAKEGKGSARQKQVTEENWEDLLDRHGRVERPLLGAERDSRSAEESLQTPGDADLADDASWAIVISVSSGRCRV